jgi:hypothetical protein
VRGVGFRRMRGAARAHLRQWCALAGAAAVCAGLVQGVSTAGALAGPSLNWAQLSPASSPQDLADASIAYDPSAGNLVLFGTSDSTNLAGTYVFNGTTWMERTAAGPAPARPVSPRPPAGSFPRPPCRLARRPWRRARRDRPGSAGAPPPARRAASPPALSTVRPRRQIVARCPGG